MNGFNPRARAGATCPFSHFRRLLKFQSTRPRGRDNPSS